jgi:NAD kinase
MEEKRVVIVNKNVTSYINQSNSCVFFTTGSAEAASHLLSVNPDIMEFVGGDGTFSASLNDALLQNPEFLNGKTGQNHTQRFGKRPVQIADRNH